MKYANYTNYQELCLSVGDRVLAGSQQFCSVRVEPVHDGVVGLLLLVGRAQVVTGYPAELHTHNNASVSV